MLGYLARRSFNSRARVGRDGWTPLGIGRICCFNSRASVGRDNKPKYVAKLFDVSIHAPAWGATGWTKDDVERVVRFQFTRPRGARLYGELSIYFYEFSMLFLRSAKFLHIYPII